MTHRHEFIIEGCQHIQGIFAACECGKSLDLDEIERRLNATMALSAEDTKLMEQWLFLFSQGTQNDVVKRLVDVAGDYARILEGGDE